MLLNEDIYSDVTTKINQDALWSLVKEDLWDIVSEDKIDEAMIHIQKTILMAHVDKLKVEMTSTKANFQNFKTATDFWKSREDEFPKEFLKYVKMMLCIMATSIPSERTFKSASALYEGRPNMSSSILEMSVMIRENRQFLPYINAVDVKNWIQQEKGQEYEDCMEE